MTLVTVALALWMFGQGDSAPTLDTVLERFRTYFSHYAAQYSATLALERYKQTFTTHNGANEDYRRLDQPFAIALESEFAIMRLTATPQWLGFRDVRRVNGNPVASSSRSLADAMRESPAAAIELGWTIVKESARYNLGPGFRSINNPSLALEILDPRHHPRFQFTKEREERVEGVAAWCIRFAERARPTVVQTLDGENNPSHGRAWIDPATGTLLKAEVEVVGLKESFDDDRRRLGLSILVVFAKDARLDMFVPVSMRERYIVGTQMVVSGEATYRDYRRFSAASRLVTPP
jgi:hypothetical protein